MPSSDPGGAKPRVLLIHLSELSQASWQTASPSGLSLTGFATSSSARSSPGSASRHFSDAGPENDGRQRADIASHHEGDKSA
jgi:hypothetical protein